MQRLEVSGAVRPIYESIGVKRLITGAYRPSETEQRSAEPALWNNHGPVIPKQGGRGLQTYALSRIRTYARGLKLCGSAEIMCEIFSRY